MIRNTIALVGALWLATPTHAITIRGRDEATCIYQIAASLLQYTSWNHLQMEDTIYFRDSLRSAREYTIYATSSTNTPRDYKISFKATWTASPIGSCVRPTNEPFNVTSSQGHVVVHFRVVAEVVDPTELPLDPSDEREPIAVFNLERSFGGQSVEAPGSRDPNAPVSLTFDAQTVELLRSQGITIGAELAGAYGLGRLATPARRSLRVLRTAGRAALALDAGSRAYLIVGEGSNPGFIALPRVAGEILPNVWDRIQSQITVTGSMRVPASYIRQFYDGNQRRRVTVTQMPPADPIEEN